MSKTKRPEPSGTIRLRYQHHALTLPPPEETLTESPTWLCGRGPVYFADGPVTLVMALEEEASSSHPSMIEAHAEVLLIWAKLANDLLGTTSLEAPERKGMGFNVLVFCTELASALHSERFGPTISPDLRNRTLEVVAQATLQTGACLVATVRDYRASLS